MKFPLGEDSVLSALTGIEKLPKLKARVLDKIIL